MELLKIVVEQDFGDTSLINISLLLNFNYHECRKHCRGDWGVLTHYLQNDFFILFFKC